MYKEDRSSFWENIYLDNDARWDLGGVTPVFDRISEEFNIGRVLFIGCGRGYDAIMFAKKGFDVTGVDFADTAINDLKNMCKESNTNIEALRQDFFNISTKYYGKYDYVIEQTCFCAINPKRRKEYERLVFQLLRPNGYLIGLWFPLDKPKSDGGPPYGVDIEEIENIFSERWYKEREEFPHDSILARKNREKLIVFKRQSQF